MAENMDRRLQMAAEMKRGRAGRAGGQNGNQPAPEALAWYRAQPAEGGPAYALTSTGYVIL
jgi:hypothetical protein